MKRNYSITSQSLICAGLCGLFFKGTIIDFFRILGKAFIGYEMFFFTQLIESFCIIFMIIGVFSILVKCPKYVIIPFITAVLIWCFSYCVYPLTRYNVINSYYSFFTSYLPYVWFFSFLLGEENDNLRSKNILFIFKIGLLRQTIAIISQTIIFIFPFSNIYNGYMDMANCLLIGGVISIACVMNKQSNKVAKILAVLSFIYILMSGSRGVLICYIMFIIFYIFINDKSNKKNMILYLLFIIIIILFSKQIATFLISIGINSRTLGVIASGKMFSDSARTDIFEYMINSIIDKPNGYGLYGDRVLLSFESEYLRSKYNYAIFAHNFIIEIIIDFGVFVGGMAILMILFSILKSIKNADNETKIIIIVFVSAGLVKLMWSGSYLTDQNIWILIGVLYGSLCVIKNKNKDEDMCLEAKYE